MTFPWTKALCLALLLAVIAGAPSAVAQSPGAEAAAAAETRLPAVLAEMIDLCLNGMCDRPALETAAAECRWAAETPNAVRDGGTVTVLTKTENGQRLMLNLGNVDFADFGLLSCGPVGALLAAVGQGSVSPGMLAEYIEAFNGEILGRDGAEAFALSTVDADGTHIGIQIGQRRSLNFQIVGFRPAATR